MANKTVVLEQNPIQTAINILSTDGWTVGNMRCETGARCAVGAVRAAFNMFENDRAYRLKNTIPSDLWELLFEVTDEPSSDEVVYDWENVDDDGNPEVVLDLSEYVESIDAETTARYNEAILVLADTLVPEWEQAFVRADEDTRARHESVPTSSWYTKADKAATLARIAVRTPEQIRANIELAEATVIEYNDNLVESDEGRQEILRGFKKAAKRLAKQRAQAALSA